MNTRTHMIIIKGEIRTADVKECQYDYIGNKWSVTFYKGGPYFYGYENVECLKNPEVLNPHMYRIYRAGRELFGIEALYLFRSRYAVRCHVCFGNGQEKDYLQDELTFLESCLSQGQAKNVFEYIRQIAGLSDIRNEETGEKILAKRVAQITFVGKDTALAKYLIPSSLQKKKMKQEYIPIFPFGCNNSQYMAVKNAMENQISVIQGPPGTGKTQTILNIIANILMQGKTVQIVSNNNAATENVLEKLASSKYNLGFVVAALGNIQNKKHFIENQSAVYPDMSAWKIQDEQDISLSSIQNKSRLLKNIFDRQEELAALRQELTQLETEAEYFRQYIEESFSGMKEISSGKRLYAKDWIELWQECQLLIEEKGRIGLFFKLKNMMRYGIWNFRFYGQEISEIITTFQRFYYTAKQKELAEHIVEIENYLESAGDHVLEEMCEQSMVLLKGRLAEKYAEKKSRTVFEEEDLWKSPYRVLEEYPIVLSTTFSSRNSLNSEVVYDYLIMDEASQVDVATGALALSCARNAVIVGDTKQLPNVVTEDVKKQAKAIFDNFHIHEGYQFTKSFLQSVIDVMPNVTQTLLREHYRCHPKIINFCNQKFYRGELVIMTEDNGEEDVLAVVKTVPGNHVRAHYSQRQIDVIREEVIPKYVMDIERTGIIAPYKNQVEALEREFDDIDVATVHKFQGKEKDTIIISTVDDEITDFADDPYLINVAVSRAKQKLMLVVTGNEQARECNITDLIAYIQYQNFDVIESKVYSIFDYLYHQYYEERQEYLKKHRRISEYDSENLMYAFIKDILTEDKYASLDIVCHAQIRMLIKDFSLINEEELRYAMNPATHIDFLIFNRITKKPVLAVEVDGYSFHKEGLKQHHRDLMKNHILELYGIPLLRFATNGSGEREKIMEKLNSLLL